MNWKWSGKFWHSQAGVVAEIDTEWYGHTRRSMLQETALGPFDTKEEAMLDVEEGYKIYMLSSAVEPKYDEDNPGLSTQAAQWIN